MLVMHPSNRYQLNPKEGGRVGQTRRKDKTKLATTNSPTATENFTFMKTKTTTSLAYASCRRMVMVGGIGKGTD